MAFRQVWTLPVYLIAFVALWFHLTHGFWSMMQTVGWNNDVWMKRLKCIGNWWVSIVVVLFMAEAIWFTVEANRGTYYDCPVLVEQYQEMAAEGEDSFTQGAAPCAAAEAGCQQACTENVDVIVND